MKMLVESRYIGSEEVDTQLVCPEDCLDSLLEDLIDGGYSYTVFGTDDTGPCSVCQYGDGSPREMPSPARAKHLTTA